MTFPVHSARHSPEWNMLPAGTVFRACKETSQSYFLISYIGNIRFFLNIKCEQLIVTNYLTFSVGNKAVCGK
jgi:hypothetical protein